MSVLFTGIAAVIDTAQAFITGSSNVAYANYQSAVAERNARQERLNAAAATARANAAAQTIDANTDSQISQMRRKNVIDLSQNRALMGGSGFQTGNGSALLMAIDNAEEAELEVRNMQIKGRYQAELTRYEGELNAYGHLQNAAAYDAEAEWADKQSSAATTNMWISGISSAVGGLAKTAKTWYTTGGIGGMKNQASLLS